jgi:hypothetical protein
MTKQLPPASFVRSFVSQVAVVAAVLISLVAPAQAQSDDATAILKRMADYVASQKAVSFTFDSSIEIVTADLEKIQFDNSGQVQLSRPDKIRAARLGGYSNVELVFDGKTLTIVSKDRNKFAQVEAPGSVDQLVGVLRDNYRARLPGADLLLARVFDELSLSVVVAKNIGRGVVDGVECHHLAFRNLEVDWQIWIEADVEPIPRKYVITSKNVPGSPQFTLRIKEWRKEVSPDAFVFKPPAGATKVAIEALGGTNEVPPGSVVAKEWK